MALAEPGESLWRVSRVCRPGGLPQRPAGRLDAPACPGYALEGRRRVRCGGPGAFIEDCSRPRPRTDGALPSTHVVARLARCDRDESRHGSSCGASAGSGTLAGALPSVSNAFVPCITPSPDFCRTLMGESTKTIDGYL